MPLSEFITSVIPNNPHADNTNYRGVFFTVLSTPVTVRSLGRFKISGNSQVHHIVLQDTGYTVIAQADVDLSTGSAGAFVYTALGSGVVLAAGASYYLASLEFRGGDVWYDSGGSNNVFASYFNGTTTSIQVGGDSTTIPDGTSITYSGFGGSGFVPPGFQFDLGGATAIRGGLLQKRRKLVAA